MGSLPTDGSASVLPVTWALREGDSREVLRTLESASVDAIVTSPPYADQREYGGSHKGTIDGYAEWLTPFLQDLLRVCKPTGSMLLNIGRLHRGGTERGIAEEGRRAAQACGWQWIDTVIWSKPNAFYAASAPYLHSCHEYVWWLAPTTSAYRGYDADTRTPYSPESLKRIEQGFRTNRSKDGSRYSKTFAGPAKPGNPDGACPKSVVSYPTGASRGLKHPAPMNEDLARLLVSLACPPAGLVLDPFAGSCTTGRAALDRGRSFLGIEQHREYYEEGLSRMEQITPPLFPTEAAA